MSAEHGGKARLTLVNSGIKPCIKPINIFVDKRYKCAKIEFDWNLDAMFLQKMSAVQSKLTNKGGR